MSHHSFNADRQCWHLCPTCPSGKRDWCHRITADELEGALDKWIKKCPRCKKQKRINALDDVIRSKDEEIKALEVECFDLQAQIADLK